MFTTSFAFCQSEVFKPVVNNLALYKKKKDFKFLAAAKKSVDSLITTHADSIDYKKGIYRALVYSTILYLDSANTLKQPATLFSQTITLVDKLLANKKSSSFLDQLDYIKRCIANVYMRIGFQAINISDFVNAEKAFLKAQAYVPTFKELDFYIAYSNNKLGNLQDAAKYYNHLVDADTAKAEYIEAAANIYKSLGDTSKALDVIKKGRTRFPDDKLLLMNLANIYSNKKDYVALAPLLTPLIGVYPNNASVAFVAANCYDNLGQYKQAETYYLQAIDLNSSIYDPVFDLGLLYYKESLIFPTDKIKNINLAVAMLEKANEISPNDVNSLKVLQLIYTQTKNNNQLIKVNNQLKQLNNQ
ncbi:tetratricopeptide repeat protein [Mucilaginibacter sp.]